MTDPHMTPTNDAPVTVEQCDRAIANEVLERSFAEGRMLTIRDLALIAARSRAATQVRLTSVSASPNRQIVVQELQKRRGRVRPDSKEATGVRIPVALLDQAIASLINAK